MKAQRYLSKKIHETIGKGPVCLFYFFVASLVNTTKSWHM